MVRVFDSPRSCLRVAAVLAALLVSAVAALGLGALPAMAAGEDDFVITWETAGPGETIAIPATGTYTIDWGDGTVDANVAGPQTHTYASAGNHTIRISGGLMAISFFNNTDAAKMQSIDQWGSIEWTNMQSAFEGASEMVYNATDTPDLSGVNNTNYMFWGASKFNGNLSGWDVSSVRTMRSMFINASSFNQDLTDWNVSGATDMHAMFKGASKFNGDVSSWNVSGVTNTRWMFRDASSFNQDLTDWNVSNVANMTGMFLNATSFNGDVSSWNVSGVTDMSGMFLNATSFNGDVSSWNVSSVTSMRWMFWGASSFNQDLTDWNVSNVASMRWMFALASAFNQDLSSWNVSGVTDMFAMFADASVFNSNISGWDVSNVRTMRSMFVNASSFNQDLSSWNVSSVTNMTNMFYNATSFNQDLSSWNVSGVADMRWMFEDASSFNQDLTDWNVSGVTNMTGMFLNAASFNGDVSSWNVSSVTDMERMFLNATSFNGDVSSWNVSSVTDMERMFLNATSFNGDVSSWNVSSVTDMERMFLNATSFNGDVSSWNVSSVTDMERMFLNATSFNGDVSSWNVSSVTDMERMFLNATSFNGDVSSWNVSGVTNMTGMFQSATSFDQNLGSWYVVPDSTLIVRSKAPGVVGNIFAQNPFLDGHDPTYGIGAGGDSDRFEISDGNKLNMTSVDSDQDSYTANVTASGGTVFEDGNNWHIFTVTVVDAVNPPTSKRPSSPPPAVDLNTPTDDSDVVRQDRGGGSSRQSLRYLPALDLSSMIHSGIVPIPSDILQTAIAFDPSVPIRPSYDWLGLDPPVIINDHGYLLAGPVNTLEPQAIMEGESASIVFTVYDFFDIASLAVYLVPHGSDARISDNATRFLYNGGVPVTADPWNLIADVDVRIEDDAYRQTKKRVSLDVEFENAVGTIDMEIRIWTVDSRSTTVQVLNAMEILADPDRVVLEPEPPPGQEPPVSPAAALRMWAGSGPATIGDAGLLAALGLDYPDAEIPAWVKTGLAPLVINNGIAVDEFTTALEYVLGAMQDRGTRDAAASQPADPDTTAPTVASIERSDPAGETASAQTLVFAVTFSEDVTGVDAGDFALSPDGGFGQFTRTSTPGFAIPDNAAAVSDAITAPGPGTATSVSVSVDIAHPYIGDLTVELVAPDGTARTLHDRSGGNADGIGQAYAPDFGGAGIAGDWTLRVRDHATRDAGTLNGWTLTVGHGGAGGSVTGLAGSGSWYLVTVSAPWEGTYGLYVIRDSDIADAAGNPLADTAPTGPDHTYTRTGP